jgi:hypothetical protein
MTKVLSMILTLVMFLSVSTPAFAWGNIGIGDGWDRDIGEDEVRDFDVDVEEGEEEYDYFSTFDEETGINVTVEAPLGALPTLAEVRVEPVDTESVRDAVDGLVEGEHQILVAMDISFWLDDVEIEPEEPVRVRIAAPELEGRSDLTVVHIPDEDEPETMELITDEDELKFELATNEVCFESGDFSVYAVIGGNEPDENARLQVRFFHHDNDTEPVYSVYVTQRDVEILGNIIEDPNVPEVSGNELFCGWSVGKDYTAEDVDGKHTIDFIRGEVKKYLQTHDIHEGDTFDVYAMVFHYFNVAYVDENMETTLATDVYYSKEDSYEINVQLTYAPYEQGYRFQGWQKDDGDDTIYENGSTTTVTKPVTKIHAIVQQGYWLSFEENPGDHYKGASYVPPVFCPNGVIPADAMPDDPTLNGYHLGDSSGKWFTTFTKGSTAAEDVWANPFSFSGTLTQDTTVYAKWLLDDEVNYTIIVWRQSIDDDKAAADSAKTYDYAFAVTKQVAPNTPVADLINTNTAGLAYYTTLSGKNISVDGEIQRFFGFTYNETKGVSSKDTVVKPDGTTVVNLYYDRDLCTIRFMAQTYTAVSGHPSTYSGSPVYFIIYNNEYCPIRYYGSYSNNVYVPTTDSYNTTSTQYAVVDGEWYQLSYRSFNDGSYRWSYVGSDNKYHAWAGTRYKYYTRGDTTSYTYYTRDWAERDVYTGLYDQKLSKYGYTWPNDYRWMLDDPNGSTFVSIMDSFSNSGETLLYGVEEEFNANAYHFLQNTDGSWPSTAAFTIPCKTTDGMVFRGFSGFSGYQYRLKLPSGVSTYRLSSSIVENEGSTSQNPDFTITWASAKTATDYHDGAYWTEWIDHDVQVKIGDDTPYDDTHHKPVGGAIEFRYSRVKVPISYMYGTFVTGRDVELPAPYTGELKHTETIFFGASVDSYKKDGGENYYDPIAAGDFTDSSFVFEGWFVDPGCTTPYDFAGKTMLQGGITVYAKFRQREYRVFLHVNEEGKEWSDVTWNDPDQASNFRIAYDGVISEGNPIEGTMEGYVLVGWYTDQACTQPYNFSTRYTDLSMAGLAQEYGATQKADSQYATENDGTNGDVDRPWIDHMVHLYAKWREVLPGATGITLVYDAIEGEGGTGKTGTMIGAEGTAVTQLTDPLRYTDASNALSHSASTPTDSTNYQFLYWEILKKDGTPSGKIVYPGMIFEVDEDYAVVTDAPSTLVLPAENLAALRGGAQKAATTTYQAVTEPEVGHSYLMGYVSGSTVYLIGNTYYNSSNCPRAVSATVSNGEITGDYDQYLWTVTDNSSDQLLFQNATAGYLGLDSNFYLNFGTSYNTWTFSNNKVVNTTSATSYTKIVYSYGYFDVTSGTGSNITFFEEVVQGNPVTYTKVDTPVPGISYVIVEDGVDYALSGTHHANTVNPESGNSWLNAVEISRSGNTVTILDTQAADLTWTAGGNATNGWTWQNVGNGKYLNYTTASDAYLTVKTSAASWQYTGDNYFYCAAITDGYNYVSFSSSDGYNDYTVAKSGSAIGIYALTHTLTINYVYADGTTAAETHVGQIPEGVDYTVESPEIEGYNVDQATVSGAMGTADVTVTVTYTPASHTVTFKDWDGTVLKTETVAHGEHATAPNAPTREGYIFTHWDPNPETTEITENLIITAQYTREGFFIVTFKDWNGRVLKTEEVERGHDATAPEEAPSRTGFTFNGWDKDFTNVQSDLVVYATYATQVTKVYTITLQARYGPRYQQEKTHITWYANNGTGDFENSEGVFMNENIKIPMPAADYASSTKAEIYRGTDMLVWENHEFLGWARVNEADLEGDGYWSSSENHPDVIELGEADLFLKYDPATKTFLANNSIVSYDDRPKMSQKYVLFGYINGHDYSYNNQGPETSTYKFDNSGELTVTFDQDSYVAVKYEDNSKWFMWDVPDGDQYPASATTALLQDTSGTFENSYNKLHVPGGVQVTFVLNENKDGTLTLSYRPATGASAGTSSVGDGTRASGDGWFEVDYVAADELMPYHAMYAVWGKVVYVYHTGTGVVERVVVADKTLDVADRTSDGYLYGGYYKNYSGQGASFDVKTTEWLTPSEDVIATMSKEAQADAAKGWLSISSDSGCTTYDGVNISWDSANAYGTVEGEANGLNVAPVAGTTYYIKEVPADKYLQPYFHYTYKKIDGNPIVTAWLISDIDDQNYTETGFVFVDTNNGKANICKSLSVTAQTTGNTIKLTPMRVFGVNNSGFLTYRRVMDNYVGLAYNKAGDTFGDNVAVFQYWVTPDGLIVTGTTSRVYTGTAAKATIGSTDTQGSSSIAVFGKNSLDVPAADSQNPATGN